ncbi:MAG: pirin family protein [Hyphomonas sp.]|nr:pirin family protein [Hyphomonas sp.]
MNDGISRRIEPNARDLGGGFRVRRVLPQAAQRMVGPFIFFDHFGPATYAPGEGFDVRPHPHIGLSTVTYLFEGAIRHRDSLGTDIVIRPGAVNWMTAGRGIVHSERTPDTERESGQKLHGLQTWVALPRAHEAAAPAFEHHPADTLPAFERGGAHWRVIAGEAFGHLSPVQFPWPILYAAFEAPEGGSVIVPGDMAEERAVYVVTGGVEIGDFRAGEGSMLVFEAGEPVALRMLPGTRGVVCGGAAMDGPRRIDWNFVASDMDAIRQAREDWTHAVESGGSDRFPLVPGDESEWIPLP